MLTTEQTYAVMTLARILGEHVHHLSHREREEAKKALLTLDPDTDTDGIDD